MSSGAPRSTTTRETEQKIFITNLYLLQKLWNFVELQFPPQILSEEKIFLHAKDLLQQQ